MSKKVYLITGSSGALGQAILDYFATSKAQIILLGRNESALKQQQTQLKLKNINCHVELCDFTMADAVKKACENITRLQLVPDVIFNVAGIGLKSVAYKGSLETQLNILKINAEALTTLSLFFLPQMVQRGSGYIVNISSTGAFQPSPGAAVYAATKAYVNSFSQALDYECKGTGVKVLTVCPGPFVKPELFSDFVKNPGLFRKQRTFTTTEVVRAISEALEQNKRIIIPGFFNRLLAKFSQHLGIGLIMYFVPLFVKGERLKK